MWYKNKLALKVTIIVLYDDANNENAKNKIKKLKKKLKKDINKIN